MVPERSCELTHRVLHSQISIHPILGPRVRGSRWKLSSRSERKGDPFFCSPEGSVLRTQKKRGEEKGGQKHQLWGEGTALRYSRSQIYMEIPTAPLQGVPHKHSPSDTRDSEQEDSVSLWKSSLSPTSSKQGGLPPGSAPVPARFHKGHGPDKQEHLTQQATSAAVVTVPEVHPPSGSKSYRCSTCWLKTNGEV